MNTQRKAEYDRAYSAKHSEERSERARLWYREKKAEKLGSGCDAVWKALVDAGEEGLSTSDVLKMAGLSWEYLGNFPLLMQARGHLVWMGNGRVGAYRQIPPDEYYKIIENLFYQKPVDSDTYEAWL